MIHVDVHLLSGLEINRFTNRMISIKEPATVLTLLQALELSTGHLGAVYVNRKASTFDHPLNDGDRVTLMADIIGG